MSRNGPVINWELFTLLTAMALVAVVAAVPYTLTFSRDRIAQLPVSVTTFVIAQIAQATLTMGLSTFVGLLVARRNRFGGPVFTVLVEKCSKRRTRIASLSV